MPAVPVSPLALLLLSACAVLLEWADGLSLPPVLWVLSVLPVPVCAVLLGGTVLLALVLVLSPLLLLSSAAAVLLASRGSCVLLPPVDALSPVLLDDTGGVA